MTTHRDTVLRDILILVAEALILVAVWLLGYLIGRRDGTGRW